MGDWADDEFLKANMKEKADFGWVSHPGTDGSFVIVADGFTLAKGAPHKDAALAWLKMVGSKEAQEAFNTLKGSILARTDCRFSSPSFRSFRSATRCRFDTRAGFTPASSLWSNLRWRRPKSIDRRDSEHRPSLFSNPGTNDVSNPAACLRACRLLACIEHKSFVVPMQLRRIG
jgi:hypothetical protein